MLYLSLVLGGGLFVAVWALITYVRKYQGILTQFDLIEAENEVLEKQLKSIVFSKSGAGGLYKELRIKYKNS